MYLFTSIMKPVILIISVGTIVNVRVVNRSRENWSSI